MKNKTKSNWSIGRAQLNRTKKSQQRRTAVIINSYGLDHFSNYQFSVSSHPSQGFRIEFSVEKKTHRSKYEFVGVLLQSAEEHISMRWQRALRAQALETEKEKKNDMKWQKFAWQSVILRWRTLNIHSWQTKLWNMFIRSYIICHAPHTPILLWYAFKSIKICIAER